MLVNVGIWLMIKEWYVQDGAVKLVLCGHWMHLSYMHQWCQRTNFIDSIEQRVRGRGREEKGRQRFAHWVLRKPSGRNVVFLSLLFPSPSPSALYYQYTLFQTKPISLHQAVQTGRSTVLDWRVFRKRSSSLVIIVYESVYSYIINQKVDFSVLSSLKNC